MSRTSTQTNIPTFLTSDLIGPSDINDAHLAILKAIDWFANEQNLIVCPNSQDDIMLQVSSEEINLSVAFRYANLEYFTISQKSYSQDQCNESPKSSDRSKAFSSIYDASKNPTTDKDGDEIKIRTNFLSLVRHENYDRFQPHVINGEKTNLLVCEATALSKYTTPHYTEFNALLRGLPLPKTFKKTVENLKQLVIDCLLAISGINKNQNQSNKTNNQELTRLIGDVPSGLFSEIMTEGSITHFPGINSFSQLKNGSPDIQNNKIIRFRIIDDSQESIIPFTHYEAEREVTFPPMSAMIKSVGIDEHTNPNTGEKQEIIDIFLQQIHGLRTEHNDHYYYHLAAIEVFEKHLNKKYKTMPDYQWEGIWRPNHALAHHIRCAELINYVTYIFSEFGRKDISDYCKNLFHWDKEILRIFMVFSRSGRESENDFSNGPITYKKELQASAHNFSCFVRKHQILSTSELKIYQEVLSDMGNPKFDTNIQLANNLSSDDKNKAILIHHIVNFAHKLDLARCFTPLEFDQALLPYKPTKNEFESNPLIPYSLKAEELFEKLVEVAINMGKATGDSFSNGWANLPQERNKIIFCRSNTNVDFCLDLCKKVHFGKFVKTDIREFQNNYNLIMKEPLLGLFYKYLKEAGIQIFPSSLSELISFITIIYKNDTHPLANSMLFGNANLILFIINSNATTDLVKQYYANLFVLNAAKGNARFLDIIEVITLLENKYFSEKSESIFSTITNHIDELIKNQRDLCFLLTSELSDEIKKSTTQLVSYKLKELIKGISYGSIFLTLPYFSVNNVLTIKKIIASFQEREVNKILDIFNPILHGNTHVRLDNVLAKAVGNIDNAQALIAIWISNKIPKDYLHAIMKIIGNDLRDLITCFQDMADLLNCASLSSYHAEILSAISDKIIDATDLITFLSHQAIQQYHSEIIYSVMHKFKKFSANADDLILMLNCEKLSKFHSLIIHKISQDFSEIIASYNDILNLLSHPKLNYYRDKIIYDFCRKYLTLDVLSKILSDDRFDPHINIFMHFIVLNINNILCDFHDLYKLLTYKQLTKLRPYVFTVDNSKAIISLIGKATHLDIILSDYTVPHLTKIMLMSAIKNNLGSLVKNITDLQILFLNENFLLGHKYFVLENLLQRGWDIIQNGSDLKAVLILLDNEGFMSYEKGVLDVARQKNIPLTSSTLMSQVILFSQPGKSIYTDPVSATDNQISQKESIKTFLPCR